MFHWVSEVSRGQTCQGGRTGCAIGLGTPRKSSPSAGTYLKFEWLHVIRAWSEVGVDQSATAERPTVRVLLQSHAVPLAVATVQTLSVTTCRTTVQTPFFIYVYMYVVCLILLCWWDFGWGSQNESSDLLPESWRVNRLDVVSSDPVEQTDVLWSKLRSGKVSEETGDSSSPLSLCTHWGQISRNPQIHLVKDSKLCDNYFLKKNPGREK